MIKNPIIESRDYVSCYKVMDKSCFYKFVSKITNKLVKQLLSMTVV